MDTVNRKQSGIFGNGYDSMYLDQNQSNPTQPLQPLDPTALAKSPNFMSHNPPGSVSPAPEYPNIHDNKKKGSLLDPAIGVGRSALGTLADIGSDYSKSLGLLDETTPMSGGLVPQIANAAEKIPASLVQIGDALGSIGTNLSSSSSSADPSGDMSYLTPFFSIRPNSLTEGPVGQSNMSKTFG